MAPTPYPNRSDLRGAGNTPQARFQGQTYGTGAQQIRAQKAVPPGPPPPAPPAPPATNATGPAPGELDLLRDSERPNEPVTAGVDIGTGPGSTALPFIPVPPQPGSPQWALESVRALYAAYPNGNLGSLLALMETQQDPRFR